MRFIRVADTRHEGRTTAPAVGADPVWVDLDQVTTITEHLGSDSADVAGKGGPRSVEHHPSIELTTAEGRTHLVALGTFSDQASAFLAVQRFTSALARNDMDSFETGLVSLLD